MIGDSYATVQDLEERLSSLDDGRYAQLLDAASRAVEAFTGRQFNRDTTDTPAASSRWALAVDPQRLPVDDFYTTTNLVVAVNGTVWAASDFTPRPWDGIYKGMTGWPFFDLLTITRAWPRSRTPKVEVTAHWGWAAVPEAIRQATLDVAEGASTGSGSGVVRAETMGTYSVSYAVSGGSSSSEVPPELAKAEPYRRRTFGVA